VTSSARILPTRLLVALVAPLLWLLSVTPAGAQTVYGTATCSTQTGACDECFYTPGFPCNDMLPSPPFVGYPGACSGTTASVSAPSSPSVIANPTLYLLHWGSYWSSHASDAATDVTAWHTIGTDWRFWAPLAEYSPGITYGPGASIGFGATTVTNLLTGVSTASGVTVHDYQVQAELAAEITSSVIPAPDGHRIYVVMLPPGVAGEYGYTGYHGPIANGSQQAGYAVISTQNPTTTSTPTYSFESYAVWRGIDSQISHEIYETTTDLWLAPSGWSTWVCGWASEVADLCEDFFSDPIDGYVVSTFWSNKASGCVGPANLDTSVPKIPAAPSCGDPVCNVNKDTLFEQCATLDCPSEYLCGANHLCRHCVGAAQCCAAAGGVWDGKYCE
jgi:hypothetical protein